MKNQSAKVDTPVAPHSVPSLPKDWNPAYDDYKARLNLDGPWEYDNQYGHAMKFCFATPTETALLEMLKYGKIIEIGAGSGYWLKMMEIWGIDAIGFDKKLPGDDKSLFKLLYAPVQRGGVEQVSKHPDRTLFICFPDPTQSMAGDALREYTGEYLLYAGQPNVGRLRITGDPDFHKQLQENWTLERKFALPRWQDREDSFHVYRRK